MMSKIGKLILNAGLTDDEYNSIKSDITISNLQNLKIFSAVGSVFLSAMFIMTFAIDGIVRNRWLYLLAAVVIAGNSALSDVFSKRNQAIVTISMYFFISIAFAFGIILGAVKNTDQLSVTFIALLLTGPMLFTDRPVRMITLIYTSVAVFILLALRHKNGNSLAGDIVDSIIFGTISSIISTYMMSVKCRKHLYEKKAFILSETDLLTGLRNRNSFEKNLCSYPRQCKKNIVCIYADVNGLHEVNNSKGHEAGDRMLQFVADSISEQFGKEHTYRIGGDEFVAFAADSGDNIRETIDSVVSKIVSNGYNLSVGYAVREGSDIDMDGLIKEAEKKMFAAKKSFYAETGYSRHSG